MPGFGGMDTSVPENGTAALTCLGSNCVKFFYLGTQRLPRLVGLPKAIEMMLVSPSVSCISEFFLQMW